MPLAILNNLDTSADLPGFSFANADHHVRINAAIRDRFGQRLDDYPLDPVPLFDLQNWLRRHQQSHNAINNILGLGGSNLVDVNFNNDQQRDEWIQLHLADHEQWADILGVE